MNPLKVFIQSNNKQLLGAELAKYSIIKRSKNLTEEDVVIMNCDEMETLQKNHKKKYLRNGFQYNWNKDDLQSFTLTRFLPPQLMNYQGRALVIDPDVFATENFDDDFLASLDMSQRPVFCCQEKIKGHTKYKTSVMLLDCANLRHWDWDQMIADIFDLKLDYRQVMDLKLEDPDRIGLLSPEWNHYDYLDASTKLIHFTRRDTQPWKTGLKIDFFYDVPAGQLKTLVKSRLKRMIKNLSGTNIYQRNENDQQVEFFYNLLNGAIQENVISQNFIDFNVRKKFVRQDIMEMVNK